MSSTLLTHRGAIRVSKEHLGTLPDPVGSTTFKPVRHIDLVSTLSRHLHDRGLTVQREEYAVQNRGAVLFGVIDFSRKESEYHTASLGIRTSNDRRFACQIICGARLVICDNLLMAGGAIIVRRKHTRRFNLDVEVSQGLDRYQDSMAVLNRHLEALRNTPVSDSQGKEMLIEMFRQKVCPIRLFHPIVEEFFKTPEPRTLFSFHQACTMHFKELMPGPKFNSTVALGKFIGLDLTPPSALLADNQREYS
jgi:hypothetical protein